MTAIVSTMLPGELLPAEGEIELNAGLDFDRERARGMRLDIPAGTAVRFEPGQSRRVDLVPYRGRRHVYGFNQRVMGPLDPKG